MNRFDPESDPSGLWMSEKLNGVFARWDGRAFYTKTDRHIATPLEFREGLPNVPLLGEIYLGKGTLEKVAAAVKRRVFWPHEWRDLHFCVFDAPDRLGATFGRRVEMMRQLRGLPAHVHLVPHTRVESRDHARDHFQWIVANGGEGIVLRNEAGDQSWKWKPCHDAEAVVVAHELHPSGLYGLKVRWKSKLFGLVNGLCDELRQNPPRIGAVVTFAFSGLTAAGLPFAPVFVCERDYE